MLILLDIDGVMVPAKGWKSPELLNDGFPAFSDKAVHALQLLVTSGTSILLTTSHKGNYSVDEWKQIFRKRGIEVDQLSTLPLNTRHLSRKMEIEEWNEAYCPTESFLIIDDDPSLHELAWPLKKRLIRTQSHIGLTEQVVNETILSYS